MALLLRLLRLRLELLVLLLVLNGDDFFALTLSGATASSYTVIDKIGDFGDDPGDGWDVAGITNATANHTLVRQLSVTGGNGGDWSSSSGTSEDNSEWIVYDQDTWDYIGYHGTTSDEPSIAIVSPENGATISTNQVTIEFSVNNFVTEFSYYVEDNDIGNKESATIIQAFIVTR